MQPLLNFISEVDKLKQVKRKTLNYHEQVYENSAEHSWHLSLAVLSFLENSNEQVDVLRCLKMAILHDVVEIDAGDQIVYTRDDGKFERELLAAKRIFGLLPKELGDEFLELWISFEKKECPESRFVGSLDRFLPVFSNIKNNGYTWKENNITREQIYQKNQPEISQGSMSLWEQTDMFLSDYFCDNKRAIK
jgi:putative hydrolases of HD superfamily